MNLGEYLANIILEAEDQPTIALFPGDFKPPHKGHFEVVEKLLKTADQVVVLVSPKTREGITPDESVAVWNLYKPKFNGSVEVKITPSDPFKEVHSVVEENPDTSFIVATNKNQNSIEKHFNAKVFDIENVEGSDATNLRMALVQKNEEEIAKYLPDGISVNEFLQALNTQPEEVPAEQLPTEAPPAETPPTTEPAPEQPLQESPPINFEEDNYQNYVLANRPKIEKAAAVFNIPIDDMEYAFNGGTEVVLNDDMWKELENTKSYSMKTLDDAIAHALKLGINPRPYIDYIKKKEDLPLPLVLQYSEGKYYLVGGEVILSLFRALGSIPTVLQGTLNLQKKTLPEPLHEGLNSTDRVQTIKEFIKYTIKELGIQKPPTGLTLSNNNNIAKEQRTFGTFNPNNDKIWLYVKNRNMADILRTLAHELVHRKQAEDNRIDYNSGETGSEIENEANAMAGILLRNFGKQNENIYEAKKNFGDYLFGDKKSGVKIGWYDSEKEEDTPAEQELFNYLKKYAASESSTYSNISLDHLIPAFKKIKKQYPEIGDPKTSGYIYRGTVVNQDKLEKLLKEPNVEEIGQNIIIPNQEYSSRRKVSSWSTNYYNAAAFAMGTSERKGGIPVVVRAKASDAELFFNPKFMNKLSDQLEEEVFNIVNPIPVDIMIIKEYKDEFEDIEAGYLHTKQK
jgi:cytidyltransferase-like protein